MKLIKGVLLYYTMSDKLQDKIEIKTVWLNKFIRCFSLQKYKKSLKIEGISIIKIHHKAGKFKTNKKLCRFIDDGWLDAFRRTNNKKIFLSRFEKAYKNKTYISPRRASIDLVINTQIPDNRPSSAPLIYNDTIPLIENKSLEVRGVKTSSAVKNEQLATSVKYKKKIWVAIGINEYEGFPSLQNAVSDAEEITTFAKEKLNFQIILLRNQEATKQEIEKIIKKIFFTEVCHEDLVVFSFHGHGTTLTIDGKHHGFIVPVDVGTDKPSPFDLISMDELAQWTTFISANHAVFFMDCCFSGFTAMRNNDHIRRSSYNAGAIANLVKRKSRIVINSGTETQVTLDGGWGTNSLLTGLIISYPFYQKTLGSVCALYNYLLEELPKRYTGQTPTIGKLVGDMGGDIFLAL